jgi:hypothetical protein
MKTIIYCLFLLLNLVFVHAGEEQLSELDEEIIRFFREGEVGTRAIDYPDLETYYEKLDWYWGQGQKARAALMYLLTEVYEGDFRNMSRATDALCAMDGDRSDILAYVRERLPKINDSKDAPGKFGHIQVSLGVLGEFGNPEDMELIRVFLSHPDVLVRSTAMTQERLLQSRIDAGEFNKPDDRRTSDFNVTEENYQKSSDPRPFNHSKSDEKNDVDLNLGLIFIILTAFLAVLLFIWKKLKTANNRPPQND